MCPPKTAIAFAFGLWTDEMIILTLDKYNQGTPLPEHLLTDLNPYSYLPSNLPDGIGYIVGSEVKKDTQFGSWKAKGEACEIFTNSVITGWRTNFEFFQGQSPNEKKTDWVMQEYKITSKGTCNQGKTNCMQDYRSLCRLFQTEESYSDQEVNLEHDVALPKSKSTGVQGSKNESKKSGHVETGSLTSAECRNCVSIGDFLELDDLADQRSMFSSSFNSSCHTLASDELFDADALLQDLFDADALLQDPEDKSVDEIEKKHFKYTTSGTVKPKEVVMHPAVIGKLTSEEATESSNSLSAGFVQGERDGHFLVHKRETEAAAASTSEKAYANHEAVDEKKKEKRGVHGQLKKLQKLFCLVSI